MHDVLFFGLARPKTELKNDNVRNLKKDTERIIIRVSDPEVRTGTQSGSKENI